MLPHRHRLTSRGQFRAVQQRGRKFVGHHIIVRAVGSGNQDSRFGFTVSAKVGGAVIRNRVKRRLREALRSLLPQVAHSWDLVVIARPSAADTGFQELYAEVEKALAYLCTGRQTPRRQAERRMAK